MTINERFAEIIKRKGLTVSEMAGLIGKSEGYVRKLMRNNESFGIEPIRSILISIRDINPYWLIIGEEEGEMLMSPKEKIEQPELLERYLKIIESQQKIIENLSETKKIPAPEVPVKCATASGSDIIE